MKIKKGTVHEDKTAYGNRFYIQIEDSITEDNIIEDNIDLRELVGKTVTILVGEDHEPRRTT